MSSPHAAPLPRPVAEAMEARVLHSADLGAFSLGGAASEQQLLAVADPSVELQRHEIAFIDASLPGADELRADLLAQQAAGRPIEIIDIAANQDGIALITQTLAGRQGITAVHVLGHSSDGWLLLGNQVLDSARLFNRAGEIAGWSQALSADADLLLYGCDLAQTQDGRRFVQDMATLTGADVAASSDATGAAARGGDWNLEVQTGAIGAVLAPSVAAQQQWSGLLATYVADPTVIDGNVGSLRWAIDQANANAGADTIRLLAGTFQIQLGNLAGTENANATGDLDITSDITFVGASSNAADTVIRSTAGDRLFDVISGNAVFRDLTITEGGGAIGINSGGGVNISNAGSASLGNVIVSNNRANNGAGIFNLGTLILDRVTISNNIASVGGGGLSNRGQATLTNVWIDSNDAATSGGGMSQQGGTASAVLTNVTFSNNHALSNTNGNGGGLYGNGGSLSGVNVTFSGNTADAYGGAIYVGGGASGWTLTNAVITGSTAVFGGDGIYSNGSPITLRNSILSNNNGDNAAQAQISAGYNIDSSGSAWLNGTTDMQASDAAIRFGTLASNGGYAPTLALLAGSAAINVGDPNASVTDQRGYGRVGRPDIGAYEYGATAYTAPANSAPVNSLPSTAPTVLEDTWTTIAGVSVSDADNGGGTLSLELASVQVSVSNGDVSATLSGGASVSGGSLGGSSFTLSGKSSDLNATLATLRYRGAANYAGAETLLITSRDGAGASDTDRLDFTVSNVNDAPFGVAFITGTPEQGQTLGTFALLVDFDGLGTFSYRWFADGVLIAGQTADTLTLTQAQVGTRITAAIDYTDGQGTAESVGLAATAVVGNINDAPTGSVIIAGTPAQGQTLTVSNTLNDADGNGAVSYQWLANGAVIAGATGTSLTLAQVQVGTTITARASYTDGFGTAESVTSAATAAVVNVNDAPTGSVIITGTPAQGQTLTVSNTLNDLDGNVAISYQWFAGGVAIAGATTNSLTLIQAQVGTTITARASYTDGFGTAESVTSAATTAVANVNDAPTGSVVIAGTPAQGQTLTVSNTLNDLDGNGTVSYQWFAGGVAIAGATTNSLTLAQAQVGTTITARASYTDGFGTAESVTSTPTAAVGNVNDAPSGSVSILGTPTQGQTLTASNTLADLDGLGAISYQWLANGAAIVGASGNSLTLAQAQVGTTVSVRASYTDGQGTAESVTSAATPAVANINDAPTGAVSVTGNPQQGQTLAVSNSLADVDGLGAISYQWLADGAAIAGASGNSLMLAQAQVGMTISVRASYTDGFGTAESVTSAATTAVVNINDAPVQSAPLATQVATQDSAFSVRVPAGAFYDIDSGDTLAYSASLATGESLPSWLHFDTATQSFSGTPRNADVGALAVLVRATDAAGLAATGTFTLTVLNANDAPQQALPIADRATAVGTTLTVALPPGVFTDADAGDTLTYSARLASGEPLPAWLSFNAQTLSFVVAPTIGDAGSFSVQLVVTDSAGARAQASFVIRVAGVDTTNSTNSNTTAAPNTATAAAPAAAPAVAARAAPALAPVEIRQSAARAQRVDLSFADATAVAPPAAFSVTPSDVAALITSRSSHRGDAVLIDVVAPELLDITSSPLANLLHEGELKSKFQELKRQMDEASASQRLVAESGVALTTSLSIGYVVWLVRGGVLMSSMLSALPAWQMIDPLPVLAAARKSGRKTRDDAAETAVERLFEKRAEPSKAPDREHKNSKHAPGPSRVADAKDRRP